MIHLPPRAPRKVTETDVTHACAAAINRRRGCRAIRNNVGSIEDGRGIPVVFGLGEGSPDLVGAITFGGVESVLEELRALEPIPLAFALEIKKPRELGGRGAERNQRAWHHMARRRGVLVEVIRTPEDAVAFVDRCVFAYVARMRAIAAALQ